MYRTRNPLSAGHVMKPGLGNRQKLISENRSILKSITIDINYVNVIDFIYRSIKIIRYSCSSGNYCYRCYRFYRWNCRSYRSQLISGIGFLKTCSRSKVIPMSLHFSKCGLLSWQDKCAVSTRILAKVAFRLSACSKQPPRKTF